ncbi:phytoene desaturase [Azotobacter chroococcum]|uniref:Phytoene desaturase (lycopene-forming) n=1 Tax=Azotobacter chroococcum TaxID=353 RepID=A0A4R1PT79_9GAMM|nr:phytoene desaturase [Azotobacter chroococcum]TBV98441.1 phytoene desaturase [Azotobacter chroococcum]TCL34955.1 phytoene desaturase [Azotobacter chroococcum]
MSTGKHAVVIGAGFGGLALAIRLQAAGIQTTLLEKRDKPGGRAYVYEDQGFVFDAGPTVITDPSALEELFISSGRRLADYVELLPVSPFYRLCWEDGSRFDYVNDQALLDSQIRARNPADVDGYRRFLDYSRAVFEAGYLKLGSVPFLTFERMVMAAPQLVRLQAWRSVYGMVSSFIEDDQLRQAFSFHSLLVGGNPFATSSIYALIHALERRWGVWFPRGGTGALVRALVQLFEELGGRLELNAPVARLAAEGKRLNAAICADGRRFAADAVASNADVVHTYRELLGQHERGRREGRRLAGKRFSMSLFVVYFGLKRQHAHLQHHTVCFGPRYRGLIEEIFKGTALPEDFSLYLHAPCVTDPSLAPPGCSGFYVLAPVPHLGRAAIDWTQEGPRYRDRILAYLERHYIPDLRQDLVTCRTFTPLDFRDELNAHLGSAFSLEPILTQSAWFRPHNRDDEIANLYIVGAGTHPGAGLPGVVGSAKATAGLMLEELSG